MACEIIGGAAIVQQTIIGGAATPLVVITGDVATVGLKEVEVIVDSSKWVRPSEWLDMPVLGGESALYFLHAVYPDGDTFIVVQTQGGTFVDWGDGHTVSSTGGGHYYDFDTIESPLTVDGYKQVSIKITGDITWVRTWGSGTPSHLISSASGLLEFISDAPNLGDFEFRAYQNMQYPNLEHVLINRGDLTSFQIEGHDRMGLLDMGSPANMYNLLAHGYIWLYANKDYEIRNYYMRGLRLSRAQMFRSFKGQLLPDGDYTDMFGSTSQTFVGCTQLKALPDDMAFRDQTDCKEMFNGCYQLRHIPDLSTHLVSNFYRAFINCESVKTIGLLDLSLATSVSNTFTACYNLESVKIRNCSITISLNSTLLSHDSAVDIITNGLLSVTNGQIISLAGTPAALDLTAADILIATNKGWTVIT